MGFLLVHAISAPIKLSAGETVYVDDVFEHQGRDILFPCKVLGTYDDCILVEEQNEEDAIPDYLEKQREVKYWFIPKNEIKIQKETKNIGFIQKG